MALPLGRQSNPFMLRRRLPQTRRPSGTSSAALAPAGAPVSPGSTAPFANAPAPPLPPQIVPGTIVKPVVAGKALIADPALIEQTQQGPLPRIADDGRTPMAAYAPPAPSDKRPRIAIVISGLGISAKSNIGSYRRIAGRCDASPLRLTTTMCSALGQRGAQAGPRSAARIADGAL